VRGLAPCCVRHTHLLSFFIVYAAFPHGAAQTGFPPPTPAVTIPEGVLALGAEMAGSISGTHACVVNTDGKMGCWGKPDTGALGYGEDVRWEKGDAYWRVQPLAVVRRR